MNFSAAESGDRPRSPIRTLHQHTQSVAQGGRGTCVPVPAGLLQGGLTGRSRRVCRRTQSASPKAPARTGRLSANRRVA